MPVEKKKIVIKKQITKQECIHIIINWTKPVINYKTIKFPNHIKKISTKKQLKF